MYESHEYLRYFLVHSANDYVYYNLFCLRITWCYSRDGKAVAIVISTMQGKSCINLHNAPGFDR